MAATARDALPERLVIVTGKGGVGKSTVAAALGVAAVRRGLRTIVAELAGRSDVARVLGGEAADRLREMELDSGLHHVRIDHKRGARPYDLVVLDGPATGQVLALLAAPRTFSSVARVGPVARQGAAISQLLQDPTLTSVVAVATPEQMAVSETLGLRAALADELGIGLRAVVANRVFSSGFSSKDAAALASVPDDPAVRSARWLDARTRTQQAHLARLRTGLDGVPSVTLPFLFKGELERIDIEHLARILESSLL